MTAVSPFRRLEADPFITGREADPEREARVTARSAEIMSRVDALLSEPRPVYAEWKMPAPDPTPAPAPPGVARAELNRKLDAFEAAVSRLAAFDRGRALIRAASSEARLDDLEARMVELETRLGALEGPADGA